MTIHTVFGAAELQQARGIVIFHSFYLDILGWATLKYIQSIIPSSFCKSNLIIPSHVGLLIPLSVCRIC